MSYGSILDSFVSDRRVVGLDRRAGPRVAITMRVDVYDEGGEAVSCASMDLGLGGICVKMAAPADHEAIRRLELRLIRSSVTLETRAIWWREDPSDETVLVGLRFLRIAPDVQALLWEVIHARALVLARLLVESSDLAPIDVDMALDVTLRTRRRKHPDGYSVYKQGAEDGEESSIFVVAHGEVILEARGQDGSPIELGRLHQGAVFGGLPLAVGEANVDSASCAGAVELLEIDRYSYIDLVLEKPLVARALQRAVLRRHLTHIRTVITAEAAGAPSRT